MLLNQVRLCLVLAGHYRARQGVDTLFLFGSNVKLALGKKARKFTNENLTKPKLPDQQLYDHLRDHTNKGNPR